MELVFLEIGKSDRLSKIKNIVLGSVKEKCEYRKLADKIEECDLETFFYNLKNKRLLFIIGLDEYGMSEIQAMALRYIRKDRHLFDKSVSGIIVDAKSELYTKDVARDFALEINSSGSIIVGKGLVEGTKTLYNHKVSSIIFGGGLENGYHKRIEELVRKLVDYKDEKYRVPKLLVIHRSTNKNSSTYYIGEKIKENLKESFEIKEVSLGNKSVNDCNGCSYEVCKHMAKDKGCFYGGAISKEIIPAIKECNAILFLCPNYNDSVSANIMTVFNRLTNLLMDYSIYDKKIFSVVVSGYSGSDIVAKQVLGAMCFNKGGTLANNFALMLTANNIEDLKKIDGIEGRIRGFSDNILSSCCYI